MTLLGILNYVCKDPFSNKVTITNSVYTCLLEVTIQPTTVAKEKKEVIFNIISAKFHILNKATQSHTHVIYCSRDMEAAREKEGICSEATLNVVFLILNQSKTVSVWNCICFKQNGTNFGSISTI